MLAVIKGKFRGYEPGCPIVLLVGAKYSQVLFKGPVLTLCLPVGLRMVRGAVRWMRREVIVKRSPVCIREYGTSVRSQAFCDSMVSNEFPSEHFGQFWRSDVLSGGNVVRHL